MVKISVICPIHRYGGLDMLFSMFEVQTFDEYEIILCDKLYNIRKDIVKEWSQKNNINVDHFEPKNISEYHKHSSILNESLIKCKGKYTIVIGDYTFAESNWMEWHYKYNAAGYCLSAPQNVYALPKLKCNLDQPFSTFDENFNPEIFKIVPPIALDPKLGFPIGAIINHQYCHNRNESFPTKAAMDIAGWDENYDDYVGASNKEFYLRLIHEANCNIACDNRASIHRIMSYPIPPFTKFKALETDDSISMSQYKELCKKYGAVE